MSKYHKSTSNPFKDEVEDDFVMVDKSGSKTSQDPMSSNGSSGQESSNEVYYKDDHPLGSTETGRPFEDRRQQLVRRIETSESTQLESTQRALASIYESEAMGIATAEELIRQGEKLDNIEQKTDGMQHNLKSSQRHLNNIRSVFGGIKNWWGGDRKANDSKKKEPDSNARLRTTVEKAEKTKPDFSGFYGEENDLDTKFMANAPKHVKGSAGYTMIAPITRSAREEEVDENLGMMCDGMSRLKGLAMGLGDEIERQNSQLDVINVKVNSTDDLLNNQNLQMRKLLRR